jgi:predicted RNA-binding Zn ribbon-like protein
MTATAAPGALEQVRSLINTRHVEKGTDRLSSPAELTTWLAGQGFPVSTVTAADLRRVTDLREALREACLANHDRSTIPKDAARTMTALSRWAGVGVTVGGERGWSVSTTESGPEGYVGAILATMVIAMSEDTWTRLRVCRYDGCLWAFYDSSRARTRTWCSMSGCGNRVKQARYRERSGR